MIAGNSDASAGLELRAPARHRDAGRSRRCGPQIAAPARNPAELHFVRRAVGLAEGGRGGPRALTLAPQQEEMRLSEAGGGRGAVRGFLPWV